MTNDRSSTVADDLIAVDDVDGADPEVRHDVSCSGVHVESATAALREALLELHRSDDDAWRRYAHDMEEATLRFDASVGIAAARLRAERLAAKGDRTVPFDHAMHSARACADELRVQAHVGRMDLRDFVSDGVGRGTAIARVESVVDRVRRGIGEAWTAGWREVRR